MEKTETLVDCELETHLSAWRRHLHQHPELSFQEHETARYVTNILSALEGISIQTGIGGTGVVASLTNGTGKTIAIRADMDALPIKEENLHDYRSLHDGIMHACGHDAHTAILLGVAKQLAEMASRNLWQGTIRLIFQPAEEATDSEGYSGAPRMLEAGVLEGVDAVIALHVCPWHPVGTIQMHDGPSMASVDVFHAEIFGSGGHAGYPHLGTDPVWMLGSVLQTFYGLSSRRLSPLDTAVASIGKIQAGTASNVIPDKVDVTGTIRAYTPIVREQLLGEVERAFKIVESFGGTYQFKVQRGEPALVNDPGINRILRTAAETCIPGLVVKEEPFGMGGEDFAYMTQAVPGAMFFLGCTFPDGEQRDLHTNQFDVDERCLSMGVAILTEAAMELLES
ncbi:M20 family metallopeptidase [Sporosarcina sp. Te-1]|uniref:M20 metallopeptidase family protein n=1 Tax=Sporosarcina sp. Te-1 TaxID=2818390 RepID=UPI0035303053